MCTDNRTVDALGEIVRSLAVAADDLPDAEYDAEGNCATVLTNAEMKAVDRIYVLVNDLWRLHREWVAS